MPSQDEGDMWIPRAWQCSCCKPSRQVYKRYEKPVNRWYHEGSHTLAQVSLIRTKPRKKAR